MGEFTDETGANILVHEDGVIKLADFNSSRRIADIAARCLGRDEMRSLHGTPHFMAPEVAKEKRLFCYNSVSRTGVSIHWSSL